MDKRVHLSKYNKKIQDGIIELVPRAKAIIEEQEDMSKPKVTLELIYKELIQLKSQFSEFKQEMTEFKQDQLKFNNLLLSLPTIKKEIQELNS